MDELLEDEVHVLTDEELRRRYELLLALCPRCKATLDEDGFCSTCGATLTQRDAQPR